MKQRLVFMLCTFLTHLLCVPDTSASDVTGRHAVYEETLAEHLQHLREGRINCHGNRPPLHNDWLERHYLSNRHVTCNDGTPAGWGPKKWKLYIYSIIMQRSKSWLGIFCRYYIRCAPSSTRWLIFLQGIWKVTLHYWFWAHRRFSDCSWKLTYSTVQGILKSNSGSIESLYYMTYEWYDCTYI